MVRWDYYSCGPREGEDDLTLFRRMGQEGWEVTLFAVSQTGEPFYWFKRPNRRPVRTEDLKERLNMAETAHDHMVKQDEEISRLRTALSNLLGSVKVCPGCAPEAECYVFSMVALSEAGLALQPQEVVAAPTLLEAAKAALEFIGAYETPKHLRAIISLKLQAAIAAAK